MTTPPILDPSCTTLTKFIFSEESKFWQATGELTELLNCLQIIAKTISAVVRGVGHTQIPKKVQTTAHDTFIHILSTSHTVGLFISGESKTAIEVDKNHKGKYIVCFDPLDGVSNLDSAVTVGSIFGVMCKEMEELPTIKDAVDPHNKMIAAGYVVYGSSTNFVFSTGHGVHEFVLDPLIGEFLLTERDMKIPKRGNIFAINEGYASAWDEATKEYVSEKKFPAKGRPYTARYVGTMVADIHRTMKHGGIFMYPSTRDAPNGKLRVMYECKPMAFIVTQAGGLATTGNDFIMDIKPSDIHQRCPIFIGSKDDVEELIAVVAKHCPK